MAVSVSLQMNATPMLKRLQAMRSVLTDKEILTALGLRVTKWVDDNFREQGRLGDTAWRPLRRSTIYAKGSSGILVDRGHLKRSFRVRVLGSRLEVYTPIFYAKFHEEGTSPYIIAPKRAGGLLAFPHPDGFARFRARRGGVKNHILAKVVHHPGLPRRPMMPSRRIAQRLLNESSKGIVDYLRRSGRI